MRASADEPSLRVTSDNNLIIDLPAAISSATESAVTTIFTHAALSNSGAVILNLSHIEFIDASGLGVLMTLFTQARQRKQRLYAFGLSDRYCQVFAVAGILQIVSLYRSEREAVAAANTNPQPGDSSRASVDAPAVTADANWATPVASLRAPQAPPGTVNLNVDGRQATGPLDGFGPLLRKTYRIRLDGSAATPVDVVTLWKNDFASFWPKGNTFHAQHPTITPGDAALLNLTLLGPLKLYTGVLVLYADETSFCFMTCAGHMFGGLITFSVYDDHGVTTAQVQPLIRSSDPFYEITLRLGIGGAIEDRFWQQALQNLAARFEAKGKVTQEAAVLAPAMQWSKASHIWYNAAIRSTFYSLAAPVRWLQRRASS
jgi:anti-anti-sigma factor